MKWENERCSDAAVGAGSCGVCQPEKRRGWWARALSACPILCALASLPAGCGAGGENVVQLKDAADFNAQVLQSTQPVLVDFYKGGCPTCVLLEGTYNSLAKEYQGRVLFASFEIMKPYFAVTSPELKSKYDISLFPTVVLLVNGQEKQRWSLEYNADKYRQVLNEVLAAPSGQAPKAGSPPAKP